MSRDAKEGEESKLSLLWRDWHKSKDGLDRERERMPRRELAFERHSRVAGPDQKY